jgi:glycosyltransferase involved in cell wall biosynthesis
VRILHLYPKSDYFTGAAVQLLELARDLSASGHHVVVATRPSPDWRERCIAAGLHYYPVPMRSEVDVRSVPSLIGIIRQHGIEVVHCHKGKARTLALVAGLFVKIPALVLNRGVSFPLDPFNRLGYTTPRVDAIVAVSQSIKRGLVARGVPAGKIHVIYSGTDTQRFHPGVDGSKVRAELGVVGGQYLITQIGVRSWKGNDDLLDALALIVPRMPQARVLYVGANENKAAILHEKAAARGLLGRVLVLPFRDDVPEILAGSDVCVDSSYAGLGITGTLREALAVGTPVIATDLEGNPELVEDGRTGLLVPPQRPDALARALVRSSENPEAARAMAHAGRQRVVTRFSREIKVLRTEDLYKRLLARAGRGGWDRAQVTDAVPQPSPCLRNTCSDALHRPAGPRV